MKLYYFNAGIISNKLILTTLQSINSSDYDLIIIVESGFKPSKQITPKVTFESLLEKETGNKYNIFRLDRLSVFNVRGGIAVFAKKAININIIKADEDDEQLWIHLNENLYLCVAYISPCLVAAEA